LSKLPIRKEFSEDFANLGHARHVAAVLENGITIHNFYVPAGGDEPDPNTNEKFSQKLSYLTHMEQYFDNIDVKKSILVGDLNIAPRPDDVWDHKKLSGVVSHTPIEIDYLKKVQNSGRWVDVVRGCIPDGLLFSWWSYRAKDWSFADKGRRLDHVWATPDISDRARSALVARDVRGWEQPSDHAPIFVVFDV
ncbi:MAG: endonuclease/exonuclease/phosphatase family protein, partial [Paracoccaceae bacterium]